MARALGYRHPRDGHRLGRPRGLARADGPDPGAGGARARRRPPPRPPRGGRPQRATGPASRTRSSAAPPRAARERGRGGPGTAALRAAREPRLRAARGLDRYEARGPRRSCSPWRSRRCRAARARLDAGRRGDRRRRLPGGRPAAVPDLAARGGRARGGREPLRPRGRPALVRAPGRADLGAAAPARPGRRGLLHGLEAGGRGRAVRRRAGALPPLPARAPATAPSRSSWPCSSRRRSRRWWAGPASATATRSSTSTSSPASCGPAPTCGATCSPPSRSALMPLALLAYERGRERRQPAAGSRWRRRRAARRMAPALAGRHAGRWCWWAPSWSACAAGAPPARAAADLVGPVAATAAPLVYYLVLSRSDASWKLAGEVNDFPRWPWWVTVLGLLPLALPARSPTGCRRPTSARSRCACGRWPGSWSSTSPPAPSRSTRSRG